MWEYKIIEVRPLDAELAQREANKLGREGWELVSMCEYGGCLYTLAFKRKI